VAPARVEPPGAPMMLGLATTVGSDGAGAFNMDLGSAMVEGTEGAGAVGAEAGALVEAIWAPPVLGYAEVVVDIILRLWQTLLSPISFYPFLAYIQVLILLNPYYPLSISTTILFAIRSFSCARQ